VKFKLTYKVDELAADTAHNIGSTVAISVEQRVYDNCYCVDLLETTHRFNYNGVYGVLTGEGNYEEKN
jgi:hypothetical protein